jgi:outer membrane protein assembly factor BamD
MRLFFLLAVIGLISLSSCNSFSKIQRSKDIEYKLRMAEQYYAKGKYRFAQSLYEELFQYYKGQKEFEDLYYKYAYCAYYLKDYLNAEYLFKEFISVFPNVPRAEECEYMRAYCYFKRSPKPELDQTDTHKAIGLFQSYIANHPNSKRVAEATELIEVCRGKLEEKEYKSSMLYYELQEYKAAAISFDNLANDFSDSKKADEYKLMVIKAYFKYGERSIDEKREERMAYALNACSEFKYRFQDSKLLDQVTEYEQKINELLKK